jgi:hypothetical protein
MPLQIGNRLVDSVAYIYQCLTWGGSLHRAGEETLIEILLTHCIDLENENSKSMKTLLLHCHEHHPSLEIQ